MPDNPRNTEAAESPAETVEDATADQGNPVSAGDEESLADAFAAAVKEKNALQDRLLRTAAEFDNYRKRIDRERRDFNQNAAADVMSELLPIVDDLERALQAPVGGEAESYRRGVELIHGQMLELLRRRGVTPIEAVGADFDPNVHQAITQEITSEHREGEVMEELRRGYMLRDRLLRPAMVKVAKRS